jgi:HAE1 family hydrophobic/amphiphilic exporter-1
LAAVATGPIYQFTLQDADTTELYKWAPVLEQRVREIPGVLDVNSDLRLNTPQVSVEMDREKLSALGLSAGQVENALRNAYAGRQVTQIFAPSNQYPVVLRVAPEFQNDPSAMSLLYVRSNAGR